MSILLFIVLSFFFNDTAPTELYTYCPPLSYPTLFRSAHGRRTRSSGCACSASAPGPVDQAGLDGGAWRGRADAGLGHLRGLRLGAAGGANSAYGAGYGHTRQVTYLGWNDAHRPADALDRDLLTLQNNPLTHNPPPPPTA